LIDDLTRRIDELESELKRLGADHRYLPLLLTVPGIGWVLGYTIASEIGEIARFPTASKLVGYTGLCPRVKQSGDVDRRGPLSKHGPRYLRWALIEAAQHAADHPLYRERYQHTKRRAGQRPRRQRRQDPARPPARRSDLAHAHPQPTLRSGRRQQTYGCLTAQD
jgi:transposase